MIRKQSIKFSRPSMRPGLSENQEPYQIVHIRLALTISSWKLFCSPQFPLQVQHKKWDKMCKGPNCRQSKPNIAIHPAWQILVTRRCHYIRSLCHPTIDNCQTKLHSVFDVTRRTLWTSLKTWFNHTVSKLDSKGVTVLCRSRELKDHWLILLIEFTDNEKFSTFRI